MSPLPHSSREIRLKTKPRSLPRAEDFEIVEVPCPAPSCGDVLIRNRCVRVSASLRMMISEGAENIEGIPFPALNPGDTLGGEAMGEVISAPEGCGLAPGDLVMHVQGWREYAAVPATDCTRLDHDELPMPEAHLAHGWTAYAALTRGVQIRPGDTVFVTSAAGAIGSMAGQIARLLGAGRVIGSTGSLEKADRLTNELGYDAAVIRGAAPIVDQLKAAAPDGIDVLLDNVGGEQLQAAVAVARENARFVIVGTLSGQLASHGAGRTAPVELDSVQLLLKKITMRGYSADDDPDARAEWNRQFGAWLRSGRIVFPHMLLKGIARAPEALQEVARGRYFGTVLVEL